MTPKPARHPKRPIPPAQDDHIRIVPLFLPPELLAPAPGILAPPGAALTYRGGPLITAVQVFTAFWGQAWNAAAQQTVTTTLNDRDQDIVGLMRDSDVLFRALVKRRDSVHRLLVSTTTLSTELTALVRQSSADLQPALSHLQSVVDVLNKNEDNIDNSLRLMAPFYRVFANTLGNGPWFDTYITNMPPVPQAGG